MKNLDREHLYIIRSELGTRKAFSNTELKIQIGRLELLKVKYEIIKLW